MPAAPSAGALSAGETGDQPWFSLSVRHLTCLLPLPLLLSFLLFFPLPFHPEHTHTHAHTQTFKQFINEDFTLREARLTYVWSRMQIADEVASHDTWGYITYVDWLESLARMAQLKCVPSPEDLKVMEEKKIIKSKDGNTMYGRLRAWHKVSVGNTQGKLLDRDSGEWGAPPNRPWVEKFQALIDLLFCVFDEAGDGVDLEDLQYWKPK